MTLIQQQVFRKLVLINFLISFGFALSDAFFPLYCENLGGHGLWLGITVGSYALTKTILSPLTGRLTDCYGPSLLLVAALVLFSLVSLTYPLVNNLHVVIGLRILQGAGCALFRPVVQSQIAAQIPAGQRASLFGRFDSSFYLALCLGSIIGGIIWNHWGFSGLFHVLFVCCLCALLLAISLFFHPLPHREVSPKQDKLATRSHPSLCRSDSRWLLLYIFGRAWGIATCATFLPIFMVNELDLSGTQIGIIMASTTIVMALLLQPAGKLADRVENKKLIVIGSVIVVLFYLLIPMATGFLPLLVVTVGVGIGSALAQPATSALLAEQGMQNGMGSTFGNFHASMNLGFVAGACASSAVQGIVGLQAVFYLAGICMLGSLAVLMLPAVTFRVSIKGVLLTWIPRRSF